MEAHVCEVVCCSLWLLLALFLGLSCEDVVVAGVGERSRRSSKRSFLVWGVWDSMHLGVVDLGRKLLSTYLRLRLRKLI